MVYISCAAELLTPNATGNVSVIVAVSKDDDDDDDVSTAAVAVQFSPSNRVLRFGQPPRKKPIGNYKRAIHVAWRLQQMRDMHCRLPDSGQDDRPPSKLGVALCVSLYIVYGIRLRWLRSAPNPQLPMSASGWHSNNSSCVPGTSFFL